MIAKHHMAESNNKIEHTSLCSVVFWLFRYENSGVFLFYSFGTVGMLFFPKKHTTGLTEMKNKSKERNYLVKSIIEFSHSMKIV